MTTHGGPAGLGASVIDIGDDVGALVLYLPAHMVGTEIEISSETEPQRRRHVGVHLRPGGACAAVYPELSAGRYLIWTTEGTVALRVAVEGAAVTEARWPQSTVMGPTSA